jgi:peptidoglycan/xylan/chitin deacetylase (PgdA/CDA1 family)
MNKNELAASLFGSPLIRSLRRTGKHDLHILAYHRILDDDPATFLFDEALISANSTSFRQQMEFAKQNFNVLSFADLLRVEHKTQAWPERALIVTFDDGYRDGYTHAFPILKELGIPATIFLTVGYMEKTHLFWWDLIAYCVKKTARRDLELSAISPYPLPLRTPVERRRAIDDILRHLKSVREREKQEFLQGFPALMGVEVPDDLATGMHLSWNEVREMSASGIEFGSHTVTHPILENIEPYQLEHEVGESKRIIERETGKEISAFAYPEGYRCNFNSTVQATVARHGYGCAVAYVEGVACLGEEARYALPRIHVEHENSLNLFRANLMFPHIMLRRNRRQQTLN